MPQTVRAKLLLGWMPQDEALIFLLDKCVFDPPMTRETALQLWSEYRERVGRLPRRKCIKPEQHRLKMNEKLATDKFLRSPRPIGPGCDILHRVMKLNPSKLVLHQFYVVTERSEDYAEKMHNDRQRIKYCFGLDPQEPHVSTVGTVATITLPHFEYNVNRVQGPNGNWTINIVEWPRFMSLIDCGDRLLLWGGYHRTYSFLSQAAPDGPDDPPLLTLITSPPAKVFFSEHSMRPSVRDCVLGDCPALFEDFFNQELFIEVSLRKQKRVITLDTAAGNGTDSYIAEP